MKTLPLNLIAITIGFLLLPALTSAQVELGAEGKVRVQDKARINTESKVKVQMETPDQKRLRGTSTASTTLGERQRTEASRIKIFQLADGLQKNILRQINQVRNIIVRMTAENSVVAKLKADGVNTAAIEAKISLASDLANRAEEKMSEAQDTITEARANIAASSSTSVAVIRSTALNAREALADAHADIKLSIRNIIEARRLISQIPSLKEILDNSEVRATTSAEIEVSN